jgi:hypothetical protein
VTRAAKSNLGEARARCILRSLLQAQGGRGSRIVPHKGFDTVDGVSTDCLFRYCYAVLRKDRNA